MRAFLFPGQGSQSVGMGKGLAEASSAARDVFAEVDEALSQNLSRLMAEGPEEELKLTANAQPAIMANAIAVMRAWDLDIDRADYVAGHSLGEYSALCAAGSFDLATTANDVIVPVPRNAGTRSAGAVDGARKNVTTVIGNVNTARSARWSGGYVK